MSGRVQLFWGLEGGSSWCRSFRVIEVELLEKVGVCEGVSWFPGLFVVSSPLNKVLEFAMADAGGENFLNKPLFFAVDNNGLRSRVSLPRKWVREGRLE